MSSPPIRKAKWIVGAAPDQPVVETARLALGARLELVCYYLPLSAERWQENVEFVHQLRVTSRRAVAALDVFGYLVGERKRRWLRRQLNKIRRSAGEARDCDVQRARIDAWASGHPDRDVGPVTDWLTNRRQAAQAAIVARHEKLAAKDFAARTERIVERIGRKVRPKKLAREDFAVAARRALPPVVGDFLAAADACMTDDAALHQFRIEGKRLRYAIELLAEAFPAALRKEVYPVVGSLQEKLGAVNDHVTAAAQYRQWADAERTTDHQGDGGAATLVVEVPTSLLCDWINEEDAALVAARAEFTAWWTNERAEWLRQQLRLFAGDE